MPNVLIAALAFLGVAATAAGAYWAARRTSHGTVETSTAGDLWAANVSLRDALIAQVAVLRAQLTDTTDQLKQAAASIRDLLHQLEIGAEATRDAREETRLSRLETAALRAEIAGVATQVTDVHREVTTGNAQTIAQLADNDEYRRIQTVPEVDRTATERGHDRLGIQTGGADE